MAKKKSSPKKKTCPKKVPKKKSSPESCDKVEQVEPKTVAKSETKSDYFLGLIKKAFGYE
jgi:hypothetical protein